MNINRHNYEEFFLLYVDNELSAADRKAVDSFVKENPDLKIELDLLQQTVMPAEEIMLEKKDWLYMEEEISSLQEDLLLYADDELPAADKMLIEGLLKTDKAAQSEWQILQQTKLQPDTSIVFEDKASLYRREPARVVGIKWWRVAAAAVLLGFGIWSGVSVYNNSTSAVINDGSLAGNEKGSSNTDKGSNLSNNTTTITPVEENQLASNDVENTTGDNEKPGKNDKVKGATRVSDQGVNSNTIASNNNTSRSPEKQDSELSQAYLQKINSSNSNQNIVASVEPESNNISRVSGNNSHVIENNSINTGINAGTRTDQPVAAIQVVNNNSETNDRYLDTDTKKRTALGGLIRKAKRVVERNTNINTGDGIKIAGFEIALK